MSYLRCQQVCFAIVILSLMAVTWTFPLETEKRAAEELNWKEPEEKAIGEEKLTEWKDEAAVLLNETVEPIPEAANIFFRAGVLGRLEELRDDPVAKILTWLQSWFRDYMTRKEYTKQQDQRLSLQAIQKNMETYMQLRTRPWWRLLEKGKPMVTRAEDELPVFFCAGLLGQLEDLRNDHVSKILTSKEHVKRQNQRVSLQVVQRNLRKYMQLRTWAWWRLWQKVKPMLKVTGGEDELAVLAEREAMVQEAFEKEEKLRKELEAQNLKLLQENSDLVMKRMLQTRLTEAKERLKWENKNLVDEISDLVEQISEGGRITHEIEKAVKRLGLCGQFELN